MTHCIIGAGFSGLPIAKRLLELGQEIEVLDQNSGVGGLWHTGVYRDAHLISSRLSTQFPDFPMPESYPDFPSKQQMQLYFKQYADHFGITPHIRFESLVTGVTPLTNGKEPSLWEVELASGEKRRYKTVTIASGHNWSPNIVRHPGHFNGDIMQSDEYYDASSFKNRRVLIVGYGNTGCDLAVDASREGACSDISMRSGNYFFPKMFMGIPVSDLLAKTPVKAEWLERLVARFISYLAVGDLRRYGMPRPSHRILDRHPIVNTDLVHAIRHGKIKPRADIQCFEGDKVRFVDGTSETYDLVVYCTGYKLSLPMLSNSDNILPVDNEHPKLFLRTMSPDYRGIFFAGIGQARTGGGPLYQEGGYAIARLAALDVSSTTPIQQQLSQHWMVMYAVMFMGLKLVEAADLSSKSLHFYLRNLRDLNRILNRLGAPKPPSATGKAKDMTPEYMLNHPHTAGGL
ncbi:NAD(P)-binding domain-containing protein [Maricurvus nonylphenolicus]|uniref:flavin-containing monooxygenase n=1 Tax=Maricurvus nonylphenolicus TaxID=1008307 RepID=UPI0036F3D5B3